MVRWTETLDGGIGQRWEATRAPAGALQTARRAVFTSRTVRLAPAGAGTKAINPSVFYPARLHSRLPSAAKIIIPWTGDIIVVNHWQPCLAPTVPLVTLYNSLDFPASIATGYRARSQKRSIKFDAARTANLVPKARIALLEQSTSGSETRRIGTRTKKNSSPTYATLDSR